MTPVCIAAVLVLFASSSPGTLEPPEMPQQEKAKSEKPPIELTGRVYARETFEPAGLKPGPEDPWTGRFSLASARVGVKYRRDDLVLDIDAELEGEPRLKDAFIHLDTGYFGTAIRAGQFKAPFAALALESTWTLPTIDRGVLDNLLIDRLQIGGRRPGAQVEWRGNGSWQPLLEMGIWRGTDQEGQLRDDDTSEVIGETTGARISVRPGPLQLGVSGAWRAAQPLPGMEFDRFWAAGADLAVDTEAGFRTWVEGGTGSSWADVNPADDDHAIFAYARTVAAWRLGGHAKGDPYVEAFGASGAIDPGLEIRHDLVWENAIGLNAGRWKRWRGQLQFESSRTSRNTPVSLLAETPKESRAVLMQIGVGL